MCILVGSINSMVETIYYVSAISISRMRSLDHGVLSKVLVECRNGREIFRVNGGFFKTS